jgi:hypothetical protein
VRVKAFLTERRWQAARLAATMFVVFMFIGVELNHESLAFALVIAVGAAAGAALAAWAVTQVRERPHG